MTTHQQNLETMAKVPSRWRSPFRALVWKEWRESWWLLVLTAAAPAAWCLIPGAWRPETVLVILGAIVVLAGFLLGARLFASETARGTAIFQGERPVQGERIWLAKILLPLCALAGGIILLVLMLQGSPSMHALYMKEMGVSGLLLASGMMAFAASSLCSVLLDRPITAMAAGFAFSFALAMGHSFLFHAINWPKESPGHLYLLSGILCLEAVVLLLLSRFIYIRWPHE